ncbi:zinc-binding alcohol dehydrogenase family protein [Streptomyces sp. NBC_00249]|uniref:quinone oxidoreductase family protein n=1 Tax=Streptomyces sp. NBC_00249 TaxID=2975690 RepID=UPI00224D9321|nr:zinc-binding alcohol dehydrogenase family protein [Streptomyces sp. NBC_00249]MCX5195263.1 zinc-binding alcohol dehydrogenase family protein [Streptomyces sp. NBC_00249]
MRAVRIEAFGGPEVLVPVELPDPQAGPGEVLVRVAAAGVNRADALTRSGSYHRAGRPPLLPGLEASGTVLAVGPGVSGIRPGQRVVAIGAANEPGFYAELAAVPAARVAVLPDGVDLTHAAALPVAWLTARYTLRTLARLAKDETVVVHAAASGVGSAAVQIAAAAGARVVAVTSSRHKAAWVTELGADAVVDTSEHPGEGWVEEVRRLTGGHGPEVVLDAVGGAVFAQSLRAVGYAGRVVALANVALEPSLVDTRDFYPKNASVQGFQLTNLMEHGYDPRPDLRAIAEGVAAGTYRIPVETVLPLERAAEAHEGLERRGHLGKTVLRVARA